MDASYARMFMLLRWLDHWKSTFFTGSGRVVQILLRGGEGLMPHSFKSFIHISRETAPLKETWIVVLERKLFIFKWYVKSPQKYFLKILAKA
jgi:hypothetical protein